MIAVGYISDTEEIIKASWSKFQHDGAAAFELSERLLFPPALSDKDLRGGRTGLLNVHQIKNIDLHPAHSDSHCAPENISDTENWLDWNGDFHNPDRSDDDWEENNKSNI